MEIVWGGRWLGLELGLDMYNINFCVGGPATSTRNPPPKHLSPLTFSKSERSCPSSSFDFDPTVSGAPPPASPPFPPPPPPPSLATSTTAWLEG